MAYENTVALVTGGSSGLGRACVDYFLQHGLQVVLWDKNAGEESASCVAIACDVSQELDVEKAMQQTIATIGIPRICINCAGIAPAKKMVGKEGAMPLSQFKQVIDINLVGTFNVMRVVAAAMAKLSIDDATLERGVIINTASIAAYEGQIGQLAYSASKGGVVAMTLPAARELAAHSIRVNTIAPGLFATPLLLAMPQEVQDSLAATVPFPQRLGRPQEFARLALDIVNNPMINGEVIRLDGALRMQPR